MVSNAVWQYGNVFLNLYDLWTLPTFLSNALLAKEEQFILQNFALLWF